ncbi:MAG: DUF4390 domain-containing protein [Polaromonas sp.]|nr:DUF4390 domain-containing protein [Polaromonas sp.]
MSTTVSITQFLKNAAPDGGLKRICALLLCILTAYFCTAASATELTQLKVSRADDGIYLSAVVQFDLPPVVEDALTKGIPMFFVVEADIYRDRWYWTDRRVASATRTIRLSFQPLTRRWRVNIVSGLINGSAGLRATLNQNYDTLPEAMSAVQRLSRWRIADYPEVDAEATHKLDFSFRLDLSQLPRPFQIGVAGQRDWNISVQQNERLQLEPLVPELRPANNPAGTAAISGNTGPGDKFRLQAPPSAPLLAPLLAPSPAP